MSDSYPGKIDVWFVILLLSVAVYLAFSVFTAIWLYKKAEEHGESGCLWAFFGMLIPLRAIFNFYGSRHMLLHRREDEPVPQPKESRSGRTSQLPGRLARAQPPDPDFHDKHLDGLIEKGRLSEACKYLNTMIGMARRIHDEEGERNYIQYKDRIDKTIMDAKRKRMRF